MKKKYILELRCVVRIDDEHIKGIRNNGERHNGGHQHINGVRNNGERIQSMIRNKCMYRWRRLSFRCEYYNIDKKSIGTRGIKTYYTLTQVDICNRYNM